MVAKVSYDPNTKQWVAKTVAGTPICQAAECRDCSHLAFERGYNPIDVDTSSDHEFVASVMQYGCD